jgi:hypothetical protein
VQREAAQISLRNLHKLIALRSGAPLIRDRNNGGVRDDPRKSGLLDLRAFGADLG